MGLCFVGKRSFSKFISQVKTASHVPLYGSLVVTLQYLDTLPGGTFVDLKGRVLGEHDGKSAMVHHMMSHDFT